jgi:hypothetical protein
MLFNSIKGLQACNYRSYHSAHKAYKTRHQLVNMLWWTQIIPSYGVCFWSL